MGWFEKKLIVMSVVVGFLYMSTLRFLCSRDIFRSRKSMELCSSYVGLSFILLCSLLMYGLMVCKLIFIVSNMIKMSWRSNQGYNKMHGQPTIKMYSVVSPDTENPVLLT